jgi:hypothetical protein
MRVSRFLVTAAPAAVLAAAAWFLVPSLSADDQGAKAPDQAALERTREQVKMLDDLYKTAVVGINDTYVEKQGDVPAAMVAAKVFDAMRKKGYHDARLIGLSGKLKNKDNVAKTEFEKKAVKEINAGKTYYEEVGEKDGKPVLRAATLVPAVNAICASCHRAKVGDKIGSIVYVLPIKGTSPATTAA